MPVSCAIPASVGLPANEPRSNLDCKHVRLQDLSPFLLIINQNGCSLRSAIQRRFEQGRLPLRIGIGALSSDLRLLLVTRGLGITLATKAAIESSPLRDALQIIAAQDFEPRVRA